MSSNQGNIFSRAMTTMRRIKSLINNEAIWTGSNGASLMLSVKDGPAYPYEQVAVLYCCVKLKANSLSSLPLRISTADDRIIETGPMAELALQPNPAQTIEQFLSATSSYLDLFGRAFWVKLRDSRGRVIEMQCPHPKQMVPVIVGGQVQSWQYTPYGTGMIQHLDAEDVHYITEPNYARPGYPWDGLAASTPASMAISQYFKADLANESSLDNGMALDGIISIPPPHQLTEEQRLSAERQLKERHGGVRNRRKTMLIEGGAEFQSMGATFKEMEFPQLKEMSREDICATQGVPPSMAGYYKDSNYSHADAAKESYWEHTILPRGKRLAQEYTSVVLASYSGDHSLSMSEMKAKAVLTPDSIKSSASYKAGRMQLARPNTEYFAWFDTSNVAALAKAQIELFTAALAMMEKGIPLNDIIDAYDAPFPKKPWGNTWWKQMGMMDVTQDEMPGDSDPSGPPVDDKLDIESLDDTSDDQDESESEAKSQKAQAELFVKTNKYTLKRIWQMRRMTSLPIEKEFASMHSGMVMNARKETLNNLERLADRIKAMGALSTKASDEEVAHLIGEIIFDVDNFNGKLAVKARPIFRQAMMLGGQQAFTEAQQATGTLPHSQFNINDPNLIKAIDRRESRLTIGDGKAPGTTRTTVDRLRVQLKAGFNANETTAQLADRIRKEFNIASKRSNTIAMTEVGGIVEDAREEGRKQAGTPMKSWLWSRKETGRDWHMDTEIQTLAHPVPVGEDFILAKTGAHAPYPRATQLSAEEAANCGCTTLARYPGDSFKAVIERYATKGFLTIEAMQTKAQGNES